MRARAKRTDNGKTVEGSYLAPDRISWIRYDEERMEFEYPTATIDPSTLEYQIGSEWYTMDELEQIVNTSID